MRGLDGTSATQFSIWALLALASGSILTALAGLPLIGQFGGLLLGLLFLGFGLKTMSFDFGDMESIGAGLVSVGVLVIGLLGVLSFLHMNTSLPIPAWLGLPVVLLGVLLVNSHWISDMLKL